MTSLRLVVLGPHVAPDTAPTGRVLTRLVDELVGRGHHVDVIAALPWYRRHAIEPGWTGRWVRTDTTDGGTITRVQPFPGGDRSDLLRRAIGFVGFSLLATVAGVRAGGWGRRADAVIAMSPPLSLGVAGRLVAWSHRAPFVFNVQDVFPDAAVATGAVTNRQVIAAARMVERLSYRLADAVTVLSDDVHDNVVAKVPPSQAATVHTIPNFVDTATIRPMDRRTDRRAELALGDGPVVLYAGNLGFSQSLDLVLAAARTLPDVTFLLNGDGAARPALEQRASGLANVRFAGFVPQRRLGELLATGDVHVVPLGAGLGAVSVPSKIYSILAAGRPVVASVDAGTEIARILDRSGGGLSVAPGDAEAFTEAICALVDDPDGAAAMGASGRRWVESTVSPAAVAERYEALVGELAARRSRRPGATARR